MTTDRPDPVFAALLADLRTELRSPRPGQPLVEYRRRLDAPMSAVAGPPVADVETVDIGSPDRPLLLRSYSPPHSASGAILFIHGGGFVIGSLDSGKRTYIMTTRRITSSDEANRRKGDGGKARDLRDIRISDQPPALPATLA